MGKLPDANIFLLFLTVYCWESCVFGINLTSAMERVYTDTVFLFPPGNAVQGQSSAVMTCNEMRDLINIVVG